MNENEKLITEFYRAFSQLDYSTMNACYHDRATFRDPVFELNTRREITGMWKMLCTGAREFELTFKDVQAGEENGSAYWEARYLFTQTGRKVVNRIDAEFTFKDGLIFEHIDRFNFWNWSRQALGLPGLLLGWTPLLRTQVQEQAKKRLNAFLSANEKS